MRRTRLRRPPRRRPCTRCRPRQKGKIMSHVVVGVDGSECSKPALRFAIEEAALRGESVRAVCAWQVPVALYAGSAYAATVEPEIYSSSARDAARQQVDEAV